MTHHPSRWTRNRERPRPAAHAASAPGSTTTPVRPCPLIPLHREVLAHFTGHWPDGYRPRWSRTPWWHLLTMLLSLGSGVTLSLLLSTKSPGWWPLLVLGWMLTVHSSRKAQLVICHYAVHAHLTGDTRWDRVVAEILSTLLLIQPFEGYYQAHIRTHHPRLATLDDPDLRFLLRLGFRPGMSRQALWRRLYWTLVSPRFHALFLWMRLRANFLTAPWYRRVMSGLYLAAVVSGLVLMHSWRPWLVAWLVPLVPLYHIAAFLQFVTEHRWLHMYHPPARAAEEA